MQYSGLRGRGCFRGQAASGGRLLQGAGCFRGQGQGQGKRLLQGVEAASGGRGRDCFRGQRLSSLQSELLHV